MEESYNPQAIEKKWRARWDASGAHKTDIASKKEKYYCLDMFPYPSGLGLHVGHWRGYVISDVWARYKKIQGYEVLHPMGWDSFGLPAENDAIKKNIHPKINTRNNIANMKRQLYEIGAMYDWQKEINTSSPEYYKWTQWIFLKMYQKNLAYRKSMPINWCPNCKTGLANEEVVGGRCERCESEVTKKDMMQWMLKITDYAERLLKDLEKLKWPEKVKVMQANWIGKSEGTEITFKVYEPCEKLTDLAVFTTRPDTLFGATYVVLAPEHPLVSKITRPENKASVEKYASEARKISEIDRVSETREKTGVATGAIAINPVNGEKIPVWVGDYVLAHYGTGAIMCVPAHDERDFEFAKKFKLPIREVIESRDSERGPDGTLKAAYTAGGRMINSGEFNGLDSATGKAEIAKVLEAKGLAKTAVKYKLRDWIYSRQRYWGEPIPIVYCDKCGEVPLSEKDLPLLLPDVEKYQPSGTGKSPLANIDKFVNTRCPKCGGNAKRETDTMPQWAGSSWYFLRYPNPDLDSAAFDKDTVNRWLPVDCYVGGVEHAILHLLYARFFTKVLYDSGCLKFDEPFERLFNQGMILKENEKTGKLEKMSKSKGNVVNPDELVSRYGTDTIRMYELFVGPPEVDSEWSDRGIEGVYKFLRRSWDWVLDRKSSAGDEDDGKAAFEINTLICKVTERLEDFKLNTAISAFMEFLNAASSGEVKAGKVSRKTVDAYITLLAPFAPHLAEELWEVTGHKRSVFEAKWPSHDRRIIVTDTIEIPVQVNGKLRGTLTVKRGLAEEAILLKALELEGVKKQAAGKTIKKKLYVKEKIVNFVIS